MCEDFTLLLSLYVDDEVTDAERRQVEAHLVDCPPCRAETHALRSTVMLASLLPELSPPEGLRSRILERTTQRRSVVERLRDAVADRGVWRPALAMAGVAGLALYLLQPAPVPAPVRMAQISTVDVKEKEKVAKLPASSSAVPAPKPVPAEKKSAVERGFDKIMKGIRETITPPVQEGRSLLALVQRDPEPAVPAVKPRNPVPLSASRRPDSSTSSRNMMAVALKGTAPTAVKPKPKAAKATPARLPKVRRPMFAPRPEPAETPLSDTMPMMAEAAPMAPMAEQERPMMPEETVEMNGEEVMLASAPPETAPSASTEEPPKKLTTSRLLKEASMDEVVRQLNASALSTRRQVKWDFARIKF